MDRQRWIKLIIPTFTQVLVCFGLAVAVEGLQFQNLVLPGLLQNSSIGQYVKPGQQIALAELNRYPAARMAILLLFWAIVGICAYLIYLALANGMVEVRNELVIDTEYANKGSVRKRIASATIRFGLIILLVLSFVLSLMAGWPNWLNLMTPVFNQGFAPAHLLEAILGVTGLAVNIYLLWTLGEAALVVAA